MSVALFWIVISQSQHRNQSLEFLAASTENIPLLSQFLFSYPHQQINHKIINITERYRKITVVNFTHRVLAKDLNSLYSVCGRIFCSQLNTCWNTCTKNTWIEFQELHLVKPTKLKKTEQCIISHAWYKSKKINETKLNKNKL